MPFQSAAKNRATDQGGDNTILLANPDSGSSTCNESRDPERPEGQNATREHQSTSEKVPSSLTSAAQPHASVVAAQAPSEGEGKDQTSSTRPQTRDQASRQKRETRMTLPTDSDAVKEQKALRRLRNKIQKRESRSRRKAILDPLKMTESAGPSSVALATATATATVVRIRNEGPGTADVASGSRAEGNSAACSGVAQGGHLPPSLERLKIQPGIYYDPIYGPLDLPPVLFYLRILVAGRYPSKKPKRFLYQ